MTQSIRPTKDIYMQSPAQICAFAEAIADRIAWRNGTAPEQHIPEPAHGTPTLPPPPRVAMRTGKLLAPRVPTDFESAETQPGEPGWSHSERRPEPAHLELGGWFDVF